MGVSEYTAKLPDKPGGRYWGKVIATIQGFEIVRYRRVIFVYCGCGKGIVGEFPQRGDPKLNDYCYHCWVEIPKKDIKTLLRDRGFKGVAL